MYNKWKMKHYLQIEQQIVESFFQTQEKGLYLFGTKPVMNEYEQNLIKAEQNIKGKFLSFSLCKIYIIF